MGRQEAGITAQAPGPQHIASVARFLNLPVRGIAHTGDAMLPADSHTVWIVISALVSVPVLSVQMTVVEPRASTAVSRLIRAWRRAIRRTATASETDIVAGSPSGTSATMTPRATTNDPATSLLARARMANRPIPAAIATAATRRAITVTSRSSGLSSLGISAVRR